MLQRLSLTSLLLLTTIPVAFADEVRIGLRAHSGIEESMAQWQATADYLSYVIPEHRFEMVPIVGLGELSDAAGRGEFDFVLTNPSSYVELEIKYGASRLVTLINKRQGGGYTQFGSVIFTRRDNTAISTVVDLKGKRFMAVSGQAFGGWRVAWRELLYHGIDPHNDFAEMLFGGGIQQNVVHAVLEGRADAGAVRTDMLERMAAAGEIDLNEIRVINAHVTEGFPFMHSTPLYPEWPFAKFPHTSDELARDVAIAMLSMPADDSAAETGNYVGWTVPLNYQPVHDLLKELHVGPYELYGQITLADVWRKYWGWFVGSVLLVLMALTVALYVHRLNRRLGQATAEITQAHDLLEERVKQRTQELEEAKDEAEQANQAKSAFLSSMSHELRTPLNAVLGFSQLMETDQLNPLTDSHLRNVQEISKAGKHLLELINDVLDLARIESGRLDLHPQPLSVVEQIDESFATVGPLADAHAVSLESEVDPASEDLVYADSTRFKQVLLNLLTNAIKYNRPGGRVVIRSEKPDAQWVRITVADTGIGIAENQMDALYEPFSRLATKEHVEGTGIGLTVTRQLVEAMGGSLGMRSTLGEGSEFWFLLPVPR